MPVRIVFFDVGGVLADDIHLPLLSRLARERYAADPDAEARFRRAGIGAWRGFELSPEASEEVFWSQVIREGGLRESVAELAALVRAERLIPFWETRQIAARLAERGVPLGIISNHCQPWFGEIAALLRLDEIFPAELVVTSFAVGAAKPEPRIFEAALERARRRIPHLAADECLFIDDKPRNVEAAGLLGFQGFVFDARRDPPAALAGELARWHLPPFEGPTPPANPRCGP